VISKAGQNQIFSIQSFSEYFVYWINGSASIAGSYLIIQRQSLSFSPGLLLLQDDNRYRGWMMYRTFARTNPDHPKSGSIALLACSPNTGDQQAGVKQGMTLNVFAGASGKQPRYIEVADQSAPFNLTGWAIQSSRNGHIPQWSSRQTTPWDVQVSAPGQGDWNSMFFNDNACVAFPDISQSSLELTTYATWMMTNPAWTHDAPQPCTFSGQMDIMVWCYLVWAPPGGKDGNSGLDWGPCGAQTEFNELILDKIVQQIPASP
jgi:hypothetical protein